MARSRGWDVVRSARIAEAALTESRRIAEGIDQLAAALVAFQAEMPAVPKTSVNPFFNSKYADMGDVVTAAQPILAKHGLAVSQFVSHDEGRNTLVTYLVHSSGQFIADEMLLMLPKDDPQGQGSAITYARRYAYGAALGIVTEGDDDGNGASTPRSTAKPSANAAKACALCSQPLNDGLPVLKGSNGYVHKACLEEDEKQAQDPPVATAGARVESRGGDAAAPSTDSPQTAEVVPK